MPYFTYNEGYENMPEGAFKISPSRISRFFDNTSNWYRECLLGQDDAAFQGNSNSFLGTVVHGLAEQFIKEGQADFEAAEKFIDSLVGKPDVDPEYIRENYMPMFEVLKAYYLENIPKGSQSEPFLGLPINEKEKIYLGGSIDVLEPTKIVDFKTTSSLNPPTRIPRNYWFQQMCYVYMARMQGMKITSFELIYITTHQVGRISEKTGKPMKDYPATATSLVHEVTDEDMRIIVDVVNLISESVVAWRNNPQIRHLLSQDLRLREEETPVLFL